MDKEVDTILKTKKNVKQIFKDNVQKVVICIVSLVYITQGLFKFSRNEASIIEILGNIFMAIILGVVISDILRRMGIDSGKKDSLYIESLKSYGSTKANATKYFDKLSAWCEYKNFQELEAVKKDIIQRAGLNWKAYKLGYYKEHQSGLTQEQLHSLDKADKCTIIKISPQELLSDMPKYKRQKTKFGKSIQSYNTLDVSFETFNKILIGIIFGLYSLKPIMLDENVVSGIIWNTFQIMMWLSFGIIKYFNAYNFIVDEYRQTHIINKTEYLNEFIITMQNNPTVIEHFGDEDEINKYIDQYIQERNATNE